METINIDFAMNQAPRADGKPMATLTSAGLDRLETDIQLGIKPGDVAGSLQHQAD